MSPESIHAMLPPPAPTALISVWGVRFAYGPTNCSLVSGTTSSSMRQTSVLVPPMSQVMRLGRSSRRPRSAAAATPPAGPDSTVATGSRRARSAVATPPFEVMMNTGLR